MTGEAYLAVSSSTDEEDTAATVARNSASMFLVAVLTRGAGLIVAVLVARFLGPSALGSYAVVLGFALLFQAIAPLGQRYVIVREVARDRSRLIAYWASASLVTIIASLALGLILVLLVHLAGYDATILSSARVVSLYLPLAGLYLVAQAALQGMERMEYLPSANFLGRLIGLSVLCILLAAGVGVVAAFVGEGLFYLVGLIALSWAILRRAGQRAAIPSWQANLRLSRTMLPASFPFAIQRFLGRALTQGNTAILPLLVTMETVGMFGAAHRVQQAGAMAIPLVTMAILPTLSRAFVTDREQAAALTDKALKVLLTIILPFVFVLAIAADQIIPLLYGPGYEAAVPVLQIIIWSQVFFAADAIMIQIMMASNNERPMVLRAGASLGASIILTVLLAPRFGATGVAWAVVLTRALNLGLDAQFVTMNVWSVNLRATVVKPLLCAALSGGAAYMLRGQGLLPLLLLTAGSYIALLLALKAFTPEEFLLLRQLSGRLWQKVAAWK